MSKSKSTKPSNSSVRNDDGALQSKFRSKLASLTRSVPDESRILRPTGQVLPKPPNRRRNQHTDDLEHLNTTYRDLVNSCQIIETDAIFDCWKPRLVREGGFCQAHPPTSGSNGYRRFSMFGGRALAHVFVYLYFRPEETIDTDVSHLCGNQYCINPRHLTEESRSVNISRIGCFGYLISGTSVSTSECPHNPRCCRSRSITPGTVVGTLEDFRTQMRSAFG